MKKKAWLPILGIFAIFQMSQSAITWTKQSDGVLFEGIANSRQMKIQVCSESVLRVVFWEAGKPVPPAKSYIVVKDVWNPVTWDATSGSNMVSIVTSKVTAQVSLVDGKITYTDAAGGALCSEPAPMTLTKNTTENRFEGVIQFNSTADEGLYGFGQFQSGKLNQRGETLDLVQKNETDASPVFLSTRGFGVLWNIYSQVKVTPPLTLWCKWATNDAIDYYFMYGPEFDQIIAAYRTITGPAPLWPKWAYGYWQCKNKYDNQNEILSAVKEFRKKGYPIDNIVQDWNYYPKGFNGCQCFEASRFPDPAGMIKTFHDSLNCHFTISVWPSFSANSGSNYNFMKSRNYLLNSNDYLGTTYDAFNDSAAFYYWKFINDSLMTKGVDAFWPDATEPEYQTQWTAATTSVGRATKVENMFPVLHSKTLYEGFRKATGEKKRVCNLTRSYCAGSQRYGAAYWTGDIETAFTTFTQQIPALLNVCMTGLPLVCTDIGGFKGTPTSDVLARWFQFGAFNPVFRMHGTRTTELWLEPQKSVEAILVKYSKLRYRLFPYVYSLAWKETCEGYTMMRSLPFDFRSDVNVRNLTNLFMFGPALLVCPVTSSATATTRVVYLPNGGWYDFWTGAKLTGGRTVTADAPLDKMPLYVRAGSILPMGPEITYADTAADPIELRVYTGASGSFSIYEDEGNSYNYEKGAYATIPVVWNEASGNLTIGPTAGSFPGMLTNRTFKVVWVSENHGIGGTVTTTIDKVIPYNGGSLTLNKATGQLGAIWSGASKMTTRPTVRLIGKSCYVSVFGKETFRVTILDTRGRVIAVRTIAGGTTAIIAERLPAGMYCVQFGGIAGSASAKRFVVP